MSSPSGVICWCFLALAVWHVSAIANPNTKDKKDDYLSDEEAVKYMNEHPEYRPNFDFVPMDLAATTLTGGRDFENLDDRRPQDNRRPQSPLRRQQSLSAEEKRAFLQRQQPRLAADGRPNPQLQRQNSGPKPTNSPKRSDSQRLRAAAALKKSPSIKSASLTKSKSLKKPGNSPGRSQSPRRAAAPAA
ncbi:unnamed protein product [Bemisia tabaci]|uniref:Uncharacterized protein n=1 Tax=Bemisia tabaci TaxID=7038 RepID=A0A9P0ALV1_BEMTA|nr:unnamed protein product [Bemisia tabaci]